MVISPLRTLWIPLMLVTMYQVNAQNCGFTISVPEDVTLCDENFVNLNGQITGPFLNFHWVGSNGYFNDANLTPSVFVAETTTYTLAANYISTTNLINNGDFESGNTGFTSDYTLSFPGYTCPNGNQVWGLLGCEGTYFVGPSSSAVHTNFANCTPHGGSNMLMLNGAPTLQQLWCQTIAVMPNTDYVFQAFATSIEPTSPAILQFSIDGVLLGSPFNLNGNTCNWQEFYEVWNSGSSTSIEICITNQNTAIGGNDFAIDDIFFGPVCKDSMEFTVSVSELEVLPPSNGLIDCNSPVTLLEVEAIPANGNYTYVWSSLNGQIETDPSQPAIEVSAGGLYLVTVTDDLGCEVKEFTFVDDYLTLPVVDITGNAEISCAAPETSLLVNANETVNGYNWILPNGSTATGVSLTTNQAGWHVVSAVNAHGCIGTDSVYVSYLNTAFTYQVVVSGPLTCRDTVQSIDITLNSAYDSIHWSGPGIVSISSGQTTIVVNQEGYYSFTFYQGEACTYTDVAFIAMSPPDIQFTAAPADTLTCTLTSVLLSVLTPPVNGVTWYLDGSVIANTGVTNAYEPGNYLFQISDPNGCTIKDSISVSTNYALPTAFVLTDTIDCSDNKGGFTLDSTNALSFYWLDTHQMPLYNDMHPEFSDEGQYSLILTGTNGCVDTLPFYLPADKNYPDILTTSNTITCLNPTGSISISTTLPSQINWLSDSGAIGNSSLIQANNPGNYTITASTAQGCTATVTAEIKIDTLSPRCQVNISDTLDCKTPYVKPEVIASGFDRFQWTGPGLADTMLIPSMYKRGTYSLLLTSANGCSRVQTVYLDEDFDKPLFDIIHGELSCSEPETRLAFQANVNLEFTFQTSNGYIPITSGFSIDLPGLYTIVATGNNGCDTSTQIEVIGHFEKPEVAIDAVKLDCLHQVDTLYNTLEAGQQLNYVWKVNGQVSYASSAIVNEETWVILKGTNMYGCVQTDSAHINADFELPLSSISPNTFIPCNDNKVEVSVLNHTAGYHFLWLNEIGNPLSNASSVVLNLTGKYLLKTTNAANGCESILPFEVTKQFGPNKITLHLEQPRCYGDNGTVLIENISGGEAPYQLQADGFNIPLQQTTIQSAGHHILKVIDKNGCETDTQFTVDYLYPFSVHAGEDTTIQLFTNYTLHANIISNGNDIKAIQWTPEYQMSCSQCTDPEVSPEVTTPYIIKITNQNGCVELDTVLVRVRFDKGVIMPNIIRPGSSNGHFTLYSRYHSIRTINHLRIFDRWGNLIFTRTHFDADQTDLGWDGTFNSTDVSPGVYVWTAAITYRDGSEDVLVGDVTVVK